MFRVLLVLAALLFASVAQADGRGGFRGNAIRQRVVVRPQFRQQFAFPGQFRQRFVVPQRFVFPRQQFIFPRQTFGFHQSFVQPFAVPSYGLGFDGGCGSLFFR